MRTALLCLAVLAVSHSALGANDFYLHNGDRVVFYGDSITDQRLYTVLTETYVLTRYPNLNIAFVHSGWGGDKVSGGGGGPIDLRLQRDVVAYQPTVMTIMLGMNDGRYQAATPDNDRAYFSGFQHIIESMRKAVPGIRITTILPSPYDDVTRPPLFPGGYNSVLVNYSRWLTDYARTNGLTVADFNAPVLDMLKKANAANTSDAQKILPDRVHPAISGHLIMAEQLIKAWNGRGVVSAVEIDASGGTPKIQRREHADVTDLKSSNGLTWTETEDALPLPFAQWTSGNGGNLMSLAIGSSDVTNAINTEQLRVSGLKPSRYTLAIDGMPVGTFSNMDLSAGLNLATLKTPMSDQAAAVYTLTVQRTTIHNDRWRNIQVPLATYNLPETKPAADALDNLERALISKQREAAQPKRHTYQLTPAA